MDKKEVGTFQEIPLSRIRPNPLNPRRRGFEGQAFEELKASIAAKGVLQPVLIRPKGKGFELVAGERRFRACLAIAESNGGVKNTTIPAMVRTLDDEAAFDVLMIENLQREDLSELEEAEGFKAWLDKRGEGSLEDLAQRTGIQPGYIRRRVAVLELPEKALKAWDDGKLNYSHLELMIRIQDKKQRAETLDMALNHNLSAKDLRRRIENDNPRLRSALFDPDQEGCPQCFNNTDKQKSLFALDDLKGAVCMKPSCFRQKQNNWLSANWKASELRRKYKTNGFMFAEPGRLAGESFYASEKPFPECRACEQFVSLIGIDGTPAYHSSGRYCLNPKCRSDLAKKGRAVKQKREQENQETCSGDGAEADKPRVAWHGEHFREEFFKDTLPGRIRQMDPLDTTGLIVVVMALVSGAPQGIDKVCGQMLGFKVPKEGWWYRLNTAEAIQALRGMECHEPGKHRAHRIADILQQLAVRVVMSPEFTAADRWAVAELVGIDLKTEWRITREYLQKKTKAEILAIGEQFGVFAQDAAKSYLFETLLKKRGKFDSCKKPELIDLFMKSGVELAGVVSEEILRKPDSPRVSMTDESEPACRVCGCTEDDCSECVEATGEPCHWVEPDLCSRCAAELDHTTATTEAA
jgi:ParB family chromosome partitioning protein